MQVDHTTDTGSSRFKKFVRAHDALPWWFFALVVAIGVAVLVYSIV